MTSITRRRGLNFATAMACVREGTGRIAVATAASGSAPS